MASSWNGILFLALMLGVGTLAPRAATQDLPYTFFFTRYEMVGPTDRPERVVYHSDGRPFAKAPDGSAVTLSGQGGWEPSSGRAEGGGEYTIADGAGIVTAQGSWGVTGFDSFRQLSGWWEIPGLKEEGWQGPPGSRSFSGILRVKVSLEQLGDGVLEAWCLMPGVAMPGDHQSDGIALTGGSFDFADYHDNELSPQGVMFYSVDPAVGGYVLIEDGTTAYRTGVPR